MIAVVAAYLPSPRLMTLVLKLPRRLDPHSCHWREGLGAGEVLWPGRENWREIADQLARSRTGEQLNSPRRAALLQQRGFSQDHSIDFLVLAGHLVSAGVAGLAIQLLVGFLINKFSVR